MKILFTFLIIFSVISAFAQTTSTANSCQKIWTANSSSELDASQFNNFQYKFYYTVFCNLEKAGTNLTYQEFKNIIKDTYRKVVAGDNSTGKAKFLNDWSEVAVTAIFPVMKKWNKFIKDATLDPELENTPYIQNYYYRVWEYVKYVPLDKLKDNYLNKILTSRNGLNGIKPLWRIYSSKVLPNLKEDEARAALKKIKRTWYRNIQQSEEWKSFMIEVELAIKSLE